MSEPTQLSAMSLEDAIRERRSVRGFEDRPVDPQTLRSIFELAQRAPSNCNIQPWRVFVASDGACRHLRKRLVEAVTKGTPPNPDFSYPGKFEQPYRNHQVDCAVALYNEMGIERNDKAGRFRAMLRNFEFFDAPHIAFIGMNKSFGETVALDVGIYLQTLMLTMTAHGISSCAQGSMRSYPDIVREEFDVSDDIHILVGLSFGYEDSEAPANRTRIDRADVGENVIFKDE